MPPADARLAEIISDCPALGPETLHIDLTNRCNLSCVFCWHYSPSLPRASSSAGRTATLDPGLARGAIRDAARLGAKRVIFSGGGEPLLHPQAYALLEETRTAGARATLISNLLLADPERLRETGVERVLANFSAATAPTYAATHPGQGARAFARLREVAEAVSQFAHLTLVFVVTRENEAEMEVVIQLAAELGARRVQFKLGDLRGPLAAHALPAAERADLLDRLADLADLSNGMGIEATLDSLRRELLGAREGLDLVQQVGCYAGWYYARINARGEVLACCKHLPLGRLDEASFTEIWVSARYAEFRRLTRARDFSRWPEACSACGNLGLNLRVHAALTR